MYRYSSSRQVGSSFRSASGQPLDNAVIAQYAPSIMATAPHSSRGERYAYIPTINVIEGLRANGFDLVEVAQTKCRDVSKRDYTRHMAKLRSRSLSTDAGEVPEIIVLNSHDGSSSYQVMGGLFRFVCANGLIAGDVFDDIRIRHTGNVVDDVIEAATRVIDNVELITNRVDAMKAITLSRPEANLFAEQAIALRWDVSETQAAPVVPDSVLRPQRWADGGADLWSTFNRVQEHLIQGGVRGRASTGRRLTTRAVSGVNENVRLNKALWSLAEGMAALKGAALAEVGVAA